VSRTGSHETEIKLAIQDLRATKRLLKQNGYRVSRPRIFERNLLVDTHGQALRKKGNMLRLRQAGRRALLTFKGRAVAGKHKSREELEMELPDPARFQSILERLGFHPAFTYEKYRTEYEAPGRRGTITLDETPIGLFLELEGAPAWIDRTARKLGFSESDYIIKSYGALYLDHCRERKIRPGDMVFRDR
jgi:adenylate cyclase class 2